MERREKIGLFYPPLFLRVSQTFEGPEVIGPLRRSDIRCTSVPVLDRTSCAKGTVSCVSDHGINRELFMGELHTYKATHLL